MRSAGDAARGLPRRGVRALIAALLAVALLALAGCTRDPVAEVPTEISSAASTATPSSGSADAGRGSLPVIALISDARRGAPDGGTVISPDALATLVAEQLGDGVASTVQTVVCQGDLALEAASGTACTVSLQDASRTADVSWNAYATRNPDGSPAVLLLNGDPLTDEFIDVLGSPGTFVVIASIGAGYGSEDVPTAQAQADATSILAAAPSDARPTTCDGVLSFSSFAPVVCAGTTGGAAARILVLPAVFPTAAPGQMVVVQPGG